ncbi:MAG: glycosyltransferase family 39 protein [Patescibacteria group bacterium]
MRNKVVIFLLTILVIASILRLWKLGEVPISPDWDEVSLGYNAYSIMQTGRDEYGKFMPVVLRSFDDYKPALYSYLAVPSIYLFGLNVWAVRLPSVIFGVVAVFATFLLVKELFKRNDLALVSSFLLAISPWHIQFSRVAFESNIGLAINILAVLFFIKAFKRPLLLSVSAFLMAINLYAYQSEKVFTPLLLFSLVVIFRKELFSIRKRFIFSALIVGFLVSLPMVTYLATNKDSFGRARGVSIFSEPFPKGLADKTLNDMNNNDKLGLILDNRRVVFAKTIVSGYISHFDLNWLFTRGDIARHHAPNMGLMYLFELPFLFIGIYLLIFDSNKKAKALIMAWFLIAPIVASITTGVPHAIRTLNFLPTFQIFTAIGLIWTFSKLSSIKYRVLNINLKFLTIILILLFSTFNFIYYLNQYFVQQNFYNAKEWQYGYEKLIHEVSKVNGIKKVVVSNQGHMDQSYMFFLFYLKYPPKNYQSESISASGGFRENHKFGIYDFRPIVWEKEIKAHDTIFIGKPSDFPGGISPISSVSYPDGQEAMRIVR